MIAFIIALYSAVGFVYLMYFTIKYGVEMFFYLATMLIAFPFAPFIVANRIKKDKPFMSKTIIALWSLVYALALFALFVYLKTT